MAAFFDFVEPASFNYIKFPVDHIKIRGDNRHFIHVYPHMDGGNLEKLGRNLYKITVHIPADENIKQYPDLYPEGIGSLRAFYEQSITGKLVLPNLGSIDAHITNFEQDWQAHWRSGESVEIEFIEDNPAFANLDVFSTPTRNLDNISNQYNGLVAIEGQAADVDPTLWQNLDNAMLKLLALKDQADLYALTLEAKVTDVTNWLSAIDKAITNPVGYAVLQALCALWDTVLQLGVDGAAPGAAAATILNPFGTWTVPMRMSMPDISTKLYGDTSHTIELLQLNAIDDYTNIAAGTKITYEKPTSDFSRASKVQP